MADAIFTKYDSFKARGLAVAQKLSEFQPLPQQYEADFNKTTWPEFFKSYQFMLPISALVHGEFNDTLVDERVVSRLQWTLDDAVAQFKKTDDSAEAILKGLQYLSQQIREYKETQIKPLDSEVEQFETIELPGAIEAARIRIKAEEDRAKHIQEYIDTLVSQAEELAAKRRDAKRRKRRMSPGGIFDWTGFFKDLDEGISKLKTAEANLRAELPNQMEQLKAANEVHEALLKTRADQISVQIQLRSLNLEIDRELEVCEDIATKTTEKKQLVSECYRQILACSALAANSSGVLKREVVDYIVTISESGMFTLTAREVIWVILENLEVGDGPKGNVKLNFGPRIDKLRDAIRPGWNRDIRPVLEDSDFLRPTEIRSSQEWTKLLQQLTEGVLNKPTRPTIGFTDPRPWIDRIGVDEQPEKFNQWLDKSTKAAFNPKVLEVPLLDSAAGIDDVIDGDDDDMIDTIGRTQPDRLINPDLTRDTQFGGGIRGEDLILGPGRDVGRSEISVGSGISQGARVSRSSGP